MLKSGTVKFGNLRDGITRIHEYKAPYVRDVYVKKWIKLSGKNLKDAYIQIAPDTNDDLIDEDGCNIRSNSVKKINGFKINS